MGMTDDDRRSRWPLAVWLASLFMTQLDVTIVNVATPSIHGVLRVWAWAIWTSGFALTVCTMIGSVTGMVVSTTALMLLLCPWVAVFGWKLQHECHQPAAA